MRFSVLLTVLAFFAASFTYAQKAPEKFGKVNIENLKMTKPPIDSTAGAVILFDFGYATFDHKFEISLEVHTRIKIFNSTEFDRGDIKIPYAENDYVEHLKAASYNLENGEIVESKVSKKDIFDEDVREGVKQKRLSIPNVKEGSIIEYTYRVNYGSWSSLSAWYFQTSIPVLHSEYIVKLPEYFTYKQLMTGYIPLENVERSVETGRFQDATFNTNVARYVAKNVPAFKEEPYMTTSQNYISKIKYELSSIAIPGRMYETRMPASYLALAKDIAGGDYYGKSLENNKYLSDEIAQITADSKTDLEKIQALYEHVRDNYEIDYEVMAEGLRRIQTLKKGYPSDLNRMLTSLLRESGYDANIVRISTRKHGLLHPIYASPANFNHSITCVTLDGKDILMDASARNTPFGMLPEKCLNGQGLVISEKEPRIINIDPNGSNYKMVYANMTIDEAGTLDGKIDVMRKDYNAANFRSENKNEIDEYIKQFEEDKTDWTFNTHEFTDIEKIDNPVKETMEVSIDGQVEDLGNIIYLNPLVYGRIQENPFKTEKRLFPVDFATPMSEMLNYRIKIPEGYSVDEVPEPVLLALPNGAGKFMYQVRSVGGFISIVSKLDINKTVFTADEYPYLREFFTQLTAKQAEQVVLKQL